MKTLANRVPLGFSALVLLAACGGEPAPVVPAGGTDAPAATPAPKSEASDAPPPAPAAAPSGAASAGAEAPPKPSSGRPAVMMADNTEVSGTFGTTPGAKLEVGDKDKATLKIPEGALHSGTVVTFKVDPKGKSNGAPIGRIYHVTPVIPPSGTPSSITSDGPPFEVQMPAGSKKSLNLAVGVIEEDDKGHEKLTWTVYASKRVDDGAKIAYFELPVLNDAYIHVTSKAAK